MRAEHDAPGIWILLVLQATKQEENQIPGTPSSNRFPCVLLSSRYTGQGDPGVQDFLPPTLKDAALSSPRINRPPSPAGHPHLDDALVHRLCRVLGCKQ